MIVLREISELSRVAGPVHLAIGVFDGVHIGHQAVISRAIEQPGSGVVVTFDQHPERVLRPGTHPLMLTSTSHRISILRGLGVRHLLVLKFDEDFAKLSAEDFVSQLQGACRPLGSIAVGSDWVFGHRGAGNVDLLRRLGVEVHAVDPVFIGGEPVSSTRIRSAVMAGELGVAERLLGRRYSVLGTVVEGGKLGRQLGFPTANVSPQSEQLPPAGVYAVVAKWGRERRAAVANLGHRPTLESSRAELRLEVHVFDFAGDLYGEEMEVEFVSLLRLERKFGSLEELKGQIFQDAAAARACLASEANLLPAATPRAMT